MSTSAFCGECGAWLGALGLEPTVNLYVAHIVEIFREVWRVLRKDGTCWINLGDSYAGRRDGKLKPKDLVGMPWRVAFALQDDGWWLRSPGIWDKPNPMPESVADRLTTSHEYVFMLAKSGDRLYWAHPDRPVARSKPSPDYRYVCDETGEVVEAAPKGWRAKDSGWRRVNLWQGHDYFFDGYAIREPLAEASVARISQATFWQQQGGPKDYRNGVNPARSTRRSLENLARQAPSAGSAPAPTTPRWYTHGPGPFVGSGTTAAVAQRLGRRAVGMDASAEYLELAAKRIGAVTLPLPLGSGR